MPKNRKKKPSKEQSFFCCCCCCQSLKFSCHPDKVVEGLWFQFLCLTSVIKLQIYFLIRELRSTLSQLEISQKVKRAPEEDSLIGVNLTIVETASVMRCLTLCAAVQEVKCIPCYAVGEKARCPQSSGLFLLWWSHQGNSGSPRNSITVAQTAQAHLQAETLWRIILIVYNTINVAGLAAGMALIQQQFSLRNKAIRSLQIYIRHSVLKKF